MFINLIKKIKTIMKKVFKTAQQKKNSARSKKAWVTIRANQAAEALIKTSKKTAIKKTTKVFSKKNTPLTPQQIKNRNRKRALKAWVTIRANKA